MSEKKAQTNNDEVEIEKKEETNNIQIADDVIASIAGMAVAEVPGVAEMAGGFAGGISEVLSGKKNMSKGIKVNVQDKDVKIDVNIIVEYGTRIPDVAFEIQKRVKTSVENMTGFNTTEVNVHVQGVEIPKENVKEDNENNKNKKSDEKAEKTSKNSDSEKTADKKIEKSSDKKEPKKEENKK